MKFLKGDDIKRCSNGYVGPSKTQPNMAISASEIAKRFTTPSYAEFAQLNRYNEEQDFSSMCVDDFKDVIEISDVIRNGELMRKAYEKALEREKKLKEKELLKQELLKQQENGKE